MNCYNTRLRSRSGSKFATLWSGLFASGIWGETRHTQNIDFVVDLQPAHIGGLCQAFPAPVFYVSEAAAQEAAQLRRPFNVIHPDSANKIGFMVLPDVA